MKKNHSPKFVDPAVLILCVSGAVFLSLLIVCRHMRPLLSVNDYYGYRELARNIFRHLDFTVPWELDAPFLYPPLFPMLAHVLTFATGDFARSIQYLNIFGASFCLVPLFLLVRKVLSTYYAALSVVFSVCYFGLKPCYDLRSDQFFCLLTITTCWYVWAIVRDKNQRAWKYFVAGVLVSLAYLAKYSGLLFLAAGAASILWCFSRQGGGRKKAFAKIAFLLAGAAPLLAGYQILALRSSRHSGALSISAYVFFDANAVYEGGYQLRERRMRGLDPAGTEFSYISFLRSNSPLSFSVRHPAFVFHKYVWGLKHAAKVMTARIFSFADIRNDRLMLVLQAVFVLLLVIGALACRGSPGVMHILLFVSIVAFFPLVHVFDERYIMPFVPLFFVLLLSGVKTIHGFLDRRAGGATFRRRIGRGSLGRLPGVAFFVLLSCMYLITGSAWARRDYTAATTRGQYDEFTETASWIKNDARDSANRIKVMSRYTAIAYLADAGFIMLPYTLDWNTIIRFAVSRDVDYIVIDKAYESTNRPDQWSYFKRADMPREHVQMVAQSDVNGNTIWILKLSGRAGPPGRNGD